MKKIRGTKSEKYRAATRRKRRREREEMGEEMEEEEKRKECSTAQVSDLIFIIITMFSSGPVGKLSFSNFLNLDDDVKFRFDQELCEEDDEEQKKTRKPKYIQRKHL